MTTEKALLLRLVVGRGLGLKKEKAPEERKLFRKRAIISNMGGDCLLLDVVPTCPN